MLITCPNCAAEYNLPTTIAAGRIVRCARCGTEWAPVAPAEPEVAVAAAAPPPEPDPVPAPPPQATAPPFLEVPADARPPRPGRGKGQRLGRGRASLAAAWAASLVVLLALFAAAYAFRAPIMQAWPPSTRAYAALGLA